MKNILLFLFIISILLCSCKNNKQREDLEKIVNEWIGKEIKFPENVSCFISGKDTIPELCSELFHREFKILLYLDSVGCSICNLDLFEWEQLIKETKKSFPDKVGFLMFLQPNNLKEMNDFILYNRFDYPVFIDTIGSINHLNRFPQVIQHQCYLLDKKNKVLAIGNPAINIQIWELFKKIISNEKK